MATIPVAADRRVEIGRIISRGFAVIGRAPLVMFGIAFLFGALPQYIIRHVFQTAGLPTLAGAIEQGDMASFLPATLLRGLLTLAFAFLARGALVPAVLATVEGRRASFSACAAAGLRRLPSLFGLSALTLLGCWLGLMLLVVPGIVLYIAWSTTTPALVAERISVFEALNRSKWLTKGVRWPIFGLILIVIAFELIGGAMIAAGRIALIGLPTAGTDQRSGYWLFMAVSAAISTVFLVISGTIQTSLYLELRNWKDGPAAERLADIFA